MTNVERFLDGLRLQREKCARMAEVVEEQKKVLASQDVDALLALVARKGTLMEEIEALQKELGPLAENWARSKGGVDPKVVREVESAVEQTRAVLADLVRLEDEGRSQMSGQREATAEELRELMLKRKARGAYGGPKGADPRFIDGAK